jgi:hypothetical protein
MADPRNELADIVVPAAPATVAADVSVLPWVAAATAVVACVALAVWLRRRRRPARALRLLASSAVARHGAAEALAARLDAWARARYGLTRVDAALCPRGIDPAAWADWATSLARVRFARQTADGHAALAALCETARRWQRHG